MSPLGLLVVVAVAQVFGTPIKAPAADGIEVINHSPLEPALWEYPDGGAIMVWRDDRFSNDLEGELSIATTWDPVGRPVIRARGDEHWPTLGLRDGGLRLAWESRLGGQSEIGWCELLWDQDDERFFCDRPQSLGPGVGPSFAREAPSVLAWATGPVIIHGDPASGNRAGVGRVDAPQRVFVAAGAQPCFAVTSDSGTDLFPGPGMLFRADVFATSAGPMLADGRPTFAAEDSAGGVTVLVCDETANDDVAADAGLHPTFAGSQLVALGDGYPFPNSLRTSVNALAGSVQGYALAASISEFDGSVPAFLVRDGGENFRRLDVKPQRFVSAPIGAMTRQHATVVVRANTQSLVTRHFTIAGGAFLDAGLEVINLHRLTTLREVAYAGQAPLIALEWAGNARVATSAFGFQPRLGFGDVESLVLASGGGTPGLARAFFIRDGGVFQHQLGATALASGPDIDLGLRADAIAGAACDWERNWPCALLFGARDGGSTFQVLDGVSGTIPGVPQAVTFDSDRFHFYWLDGGTVLHATAGKLPTSVAAPRLESVHTSFSIARVAAAKARPPVVAFQTTAGEIFIARSLDGGGETQLCSDDGAVVGELSGVITPDDPTNWSGAVTGAVLVRTTTDPETSMLVPFTVESLSTSQRCAVSDSGVADAGTIDAGAPDGGPRDAGGVDAGQPDAGTSTGGDAGSASMGEPAETLEFKTGGCSTANGALWGLLALALGRRNTQTFRIYPRSPRR